VGEEPSAATILGANFSAGFVAGTLASAATCPLDVAKTRRQIEVRCFFFDKLRLEVKPCF
jgi:solute carrier family 25 protein 39/40